MSSWWLSLRASLIKTLTHVIDFNGSFVASSVVWIHARCHQQSLRGLKGHRAADEWFLWSPSISDRLAWLINTEHSRLQRQPRVQLTFLFSVRVWGRAVSAAGTGRPSSPAACPTWCVCTSTSSRRSQCSSCCSMPKVGWPVPLWPG